MIEDTEVARRRILRYEDYHQMTIAGTAGQAQTKISSIEALAALWTAFRIGKCVIQHH